MSCKHYWLLESDYETFIFIKSFKSLEECQKHGIEVLSAREVAWDRLEILEIIDGEPVREWTSNYGERVIDKEATEKAYKELVNSKAWGISPTIYGEWTIPPSWGEPQPFNKDGYL